MVNELILKWGTLKGWYYESKEVQEILQKYVELGFSWSAMSQRDSEEQKQLLCDLAELTENIGGTIFLDWDGEYVTAEVAKNYIRDYK